MKRNPVPDVPHRRCQPAALLCAMPFQAAAEDYPSRPITLIMPFGAGNAPDTAARIIGDYLQRKHNITLLITSKPGGSGIPATLETVRARPDGYTISLTSANVLTVVPQYKKCGFTYRSGPGGAGQRLHDGLGRPRRFRYRHVQDLMDKAKAERGKYSLASPGAFTAQRFYHANVMKLFPESDLPYVAYNGGAEIVTALLGNHISAGFTPVVNFKPHKDIRVIAVCGAQRDPNYPDAPTFKEMFGDGFVFDSVYGIVAPLKTPKDRIERLQSLIKEALSDPDVQAKFAKVNMTTNYLPADEFGKVIEGYYKLFEEPIRKAKEAEKK
ncbi:MAG: Bug family tripartite tricarboxylate transporter substrate binding protein [Bilophila wadsworthia]